MSLDRFITQIKTRGIARTNRYRVFIPFIGANNFNSSGSSNMELAQLFCESTTLPGLNIATDPARSFGEVREMPYEPMYDPVSMTFYMDADMHLKNAFDGWMSRVIDPFTRTIQYYRSYTTDIEIYVDNVDGKSPYMIKLFEAYPKTVGSVQLAAESRDIMKLPVVFQYKYWRRFSDLSQATWQPTNDVVTINPRGVNT